MGLYFEDGVTLKSRTLKNILQCKGLKQAQLAKKMSMSNRTLIHKLYLRQKLNQRELKALIDLVGVRVVINVIWFPSLEEKKRLEQYVWEERK